MSDCLARPRWPVGGCAGESRCPWSTIRVVAFAIVALALLADTSLCRASRLGVGVAEEIDE